MASRISRIILFVADISKVAAFYQRHFGLEPMGGEEEGWLELRAEGCNLALHRGQRPKGTRAYSPAKIVFAVRDVPTEVARLTEAGLKFGKLFEWKGFAFADTKDPEGNPVQISSRGEPESAKLSSFSEGKRGAKSESVKTKPSGKLKDGASCKVIGGTHAGKSGVVQDINTSKTGHVTITVLQANGERFKTLAKNVDL